VKQTILTLLTLGLFFSASGLLAQESSQRVTKVGTTAAKFLSIPVGARPLALAGAYTSIANDANAIYWNPGGLAQIPNREILFMHSEWLADINFDYLAIAFNAGGGNAFGLSITAMTMGDFEVTSEIEPEGTGEIFSASSFAFGLTYSRQLTEDFMIGGTAKYILEKIWTSSASGFAVDVGTLFRTPVKNLRLGASISNFGTKMQMSGDNLLVRKDIDPGTFGNNEDVNAILATDEFDIPLNLKLGLSYDLNLNEQNRLTVAGDAIYPNDNEQSLNMGVEYSFNDFIYLRGGYRSLFQENSEEEFVLGAGLQRYIVSRLGVKIDYAFQSWARLQDVHQFSIALNF
jgi:hypothetical protein